MYENDPITITTADIQGPYRAAYQDIILTVLSPGESIDVTFYLTLSNTDTVCHYGGSPVIAKTRCYPIPKVTLRSPITDIEDMQAAVQACHKTVFFIQNEQLAIRNEGVDCTHCMLCVLNVKKNPERIVIADRLNEHLVHVQTRGALTLDTLILSAFDHLIHTCSLYLEQLQE